MKLALRLLPDISDSGTDRTIKDSFFRWISRIFTYFIAALVYIIFRV